MKKNCLPALLAALAMLLTLAACGGPSDSPSNSGGASSADSGKTYNLRMSIMYTAGTPGFDYCNWFADRVAQLTDNHVTVQVFPGSQLGDYTATFGELITGSLDLTWESVAIEYNPKLNLVGAPYVVANWEEVQYAFNTESWLGEFVNSVMAEQNVRQIGVAPGGFYGIGGKNVGNLDTLFDLDTPQNVLCRVPAATSAIKTMEALNFTPTTINYSDLYSALQTGVADCWYGGSVDLNYDNFRDVISYYVAYNYLNEYYPLCISEQTMAKLPAEYQDAIVQAGKEATENAYTTMYESYYDYFDKLTDYGITVIEPSDQELSTMAARVSEKVWVDLEELAGADNINALREFTEQMHTDLAK
ncbi:MAG: TRAP transporter substrate-binding protein DctP [Oscillibacter sp.]|nr:TRAP transporter substrate-binding protein DctP [Oscillibacter sp.]